MKRSLHEPPPVHSHLPGTDRGLLAAVAAGQARLTPAQAVEAFRTLDLPELGRLADTRCRTIHADHVRTYVIDRNINYTNVCTARCTFCAFRRDAHETDAYTLDHDRILDKIAELVAIGGTQVLMQGGMNPALPLNWYTTLLRSIKDAFPAVHVHAFSPPEMIEFVNFFDPPGTTLAEKLRWVLLRLRDAGLDSLPGGGGEIFAPAVRRKIGLGKCDADAWLTTMWVAHGLGMFTSATMMFGHVEGVADRVQHMELVRRWQDRALQDAARWEPGRDARTPSRGASLKDENVAGAGGARWVGDVQGGKGGGGEGGGGGAGASPGHYVSFISWPFQRENTPLGRVPDWGDDPAELDAEFPGDAGASPDPDLGSPDARQHPLFAKRVRLSGAADYLRTQALSRLYLDNIYSIGASWVTMGPHVGQVALAFGANDMGSVMMEENVVSSAGTTYCLDEALLCRLIREAGFLPAQRDNTYDLIRVHNSPDSPDLRVQDWSEHRVKRMHREAPVELRTRVPRRAPAKA